MKVTGKRVLALLFILLIFCSVALYSSVNSSNLETVTLQLKWKHQFQFAGYYAAIAKGYYRDVGLNVILKEAKPGKPDVDEVVDGHAQYGIETPSLLIERQKGKPVVVLASIFQHSPEILISLKSSGIVSPQDLPGKTIMFRKQSDQEIRAMVLREGVAFDQIKVKEHTWNINDLIEKKVDATSGYITDRPYILQERGVGYNIIRPITYGIDFYGDCLFTTENEISGHPKRVKAFLKASLKGWNYAMSHQEEIVELIRQKYSKRLSKNALLYEAKEMQKLMLPDVVEIGHMNLGRWEHIASILVDLKLLKPNYSLDGFLYNPNKLQQENIMKIIWILLALTLFVTFLAIILFVFNRKLNQEVNRRTKELTDAKLFSESIIKSLPGIFYVYEDCERLIQWNKNFEDEAGIPPEEMLNKAPLFWTADEDTEKVKAAIASTSGWKIATVEANLVFNEVPKPFYLAATTLEINDKKFLIGVGIDITSRKNLEEQLRQSQKIESIGRLTGGIAHDFNNFLTAILGYSDLIRIQTKADFPHREKIDAIHAAGIKARDLTRQLLAFSRKQVLDKKLICANSIIEDLLKMLEKILGEDIEIITHLDATRSTIKADKGQIEQVIMNLAINARHAMPNGGHLIVETQNIDLDNDYIEQHPNATPGPYIIISITDSGKGMDKKVIEKIFDPFFTTKEENKGTGLGLATVHGIVKQHNGQIYVYSEIDKGTTFKIYLPSTDRSPEKLEKSTVKTPVIVTSNETILIVDDEELIRKFACGALNSLGYKCLEASNGEEAIKIAEDKQNKIDLLLTDVVMPIMDGKKLAKKLQSRFPDIKVLFMSGYTENSICHQGSLDPGINFISKPLTPTALSEKIRSILDK